MDQVLYDVSGYAAAYLDDTVLYSNSWEQHLEHLHVDFGRLHSAELTANPSKCVFPTSETK